MFYYSHNLPDMRAQIYFSLHLFILICLPISMHASKEVNVTKIITDLYEDKKMCGSALSDMLTTLCRSFNAPRRRRSVGQECCKKPCNYYHIMKYYCEDPIIPIDKLPPHPSSTMSPTNTWPLRKILPSPDSAQSSIERVSQSSENNYSGQVRQYFVHQRKIKGRWGKHMGKHKRKKWCRCRKRCKGKIPLSNQINKEKEQSESSEVNSRPPAKFGTMRTNQQAPIIYPHSNTIRKGHFNYSIPNSFK